VITYNKIGHFGRLANQLFQFASTIGIAKKIGTSAYFPIENMYNPNVEHFLDGVTREIYFDIPKYFKNANEVLLPLKNIKYSAEVQEPNFHFFEQMFSIPDGSNLNGYYQTEKYFKHCEEYIRYLLTFQDSIIEESKKLFPNVENEKVSIHLRVGDYAALQQFHPIMDSHYYQAAMNYFCDENYETDKYFLVFSDDIDYAKRLIGEGDCILYMENNPTEIDLCLMSMCDHNIIANSSFSWWGAWLNNNPNKKVVAPKKWFGPAYTHNTKDLYPESWIIE
jgi:hypothetical protein